MRDKFIIQYNYGSSIFLLIIIGFLAYIFRNNPNDMLFGIFFCLVFMYLLIKETPYVELNEELLLIQYFPLPRTNKIIFKLKDIEKIEFYNNPQKLRYHKACMYIKSKGNPKIEKHYLPLTNEDGNKIMQKFKDIGVDITEISVNKV